MIPCFLSFVNWRCLPSLASTKQMTSRARTCNPCAYNWHSILLCSACVFQKGVRTNLLPKRLQVQSLALEEDLYEPLAKQTRARTCNRTNRSAQIVPRRDARTRNTSPSGKKVRDLFPVPFGERLHVRAPPKVREEDDRCARTCNWWRARTCNT